MSRSARNPPCRKNGDRGRNPLSFRDCQRIDGGTGVHQALGNLTGARSLNELDRQPHDRTQKERNRIGRALRAD